MSGGKIEAAVRSAHSAVSALAADTEVAIQFFGVSGCSVGMVQDFTLNQSLAHAAIDGATASGSTPLAAAIAQAGTYMKANAQGADRAIVLLSDGEETCENNSDAPVNAARQLNASAVSPGRSYGLASPLVAHLVLAWLAQGADPPIRLHVVGFGINPGSSAEKQLMDIAAAGGGQYFPAGDEAQLTQALTQAATMPGALRGDGDGDGRCTEVDALLAIQMAAGLQAPDAARMDVTGDAVVSELDALQILQWAAAGGTCGP